MHLRGYGFHLLISTLLFLLKLITINNVGPKERLAPISISADCLPQMIPNQSTESSHKHHELSCHQQHQHLFRHKMRELSGNGSISGYKVFVTFRVKTLLHLQFIPKPTFISWFQMLLNQTACWTISEGSWKSAHCRAFRVSHQSSQTDIFSQETWVKQINFSNNPEVLWTSSIISAFSFWNLWNWNAWCLVMTAGFWMTGWQYFHTTWPPLALHSGNDVL